MDQQGRVVVEGILSRILFSAAAKDGGDFVIGVIRTKDDDSITVKGDIPGARVGGSYKVHGRVGTDNFGGHVKIDAIEVAIPTSEIAVRRHLEGFPGIGPATAALLVQAYGVEAINAIKSKPNSEIRAVARRLSDDRIDAARTALLEEERCFGMRLWVRNFLGEHGTDRKIRTVLAEFGDSVQAILADDPWRLTDVAGFGFPTADSIAIAQGKDRRSGDRVAAGVMHAVDTCRQNGNTVHDETEVVEATRTLLGLGYEDEAMVVTKLEQLIELGRLTRENCGMLQLAADARAEQRIADVILRRSQRPQRDRAPREEILTGLAQDQRAALELIMRYGTFVLTGAPGTGKSFTVRSVLAHYMPSRVICCAPTGKAAKVLAAMSGIGATTIHRALGPMPEKKGNKTVFRFAHHKLAKLDADLVVVDEASMVDTKLFADLLDAIPDSADLLIVGDHHQLASVQPGAVLRDLLEADVIYGYELTEIKRQDPGLIVTQCHAIKNGQPICPLPSSKEQDLHWMERPDAEVLAKEIVALFMDRLPKHAAAGEKPIESIQVLCALRDRGPISSKSLNEAIQEARLRAGQTVRFGEFTFNVGDKVIQTANNYELGVVNGDMGVVIGIVGSGGHAAYEVAFEGLAEAVVVPRIDNDLQLAYAVTIHKSQGSGWPIVVVPVHPSIGPFFDRTLLYTAISRASKMCVLLGVQRFVPTIVRRTRARERKTALRNLIEKRELGRSLPAGDVAAEEPIVGPVSSGLPSVAHMQGENKVECHEDLDTIPF